MPCPIVHLDGDAKLSISRRSVRFRHRALADKQRFSARACLSNNVAFGQGYQHNHWLVEWLGRRLQSVITSVRIRYQCLMLLSFTELRKRLEIQGIIHVGAHTAEERRYYRPFPVKWVEANKQLFDALDKSLDKHWFAATDYNGEAEFNIAQATACSSLLKPKDNLQWNGRAKIVEVVKVPAARLETIQEPGYNFLNMDIQGGELLCLKGTNLDLIDYVYAEVHDRETYAGCPRVSDIDEYLQGFGFERTETKWTANKWGDALYERR